MVFPDHRAVLGLDAFAGDAGADDFREPIEVDGIDAESRFDFLAHGVGPRLGAVHTDAQRRAARVDALAAEFVGNVEHVGRGDHDDGRLEVADQLHLLFGLPAGHRDHRATELFGAVMGAEAAGEQPVAVGDVDDVARPAAGGVDRAGDQVGPHVDVGLGIADDGRLAGRPARSMDAHHLLARHGEHAVGVVVAQVLLGREGKAGEVGQRPEVIRMDAGGVEFRLVMRHVLVDMVQRPRKALGLQGDDLVAAGGFDGVQALVHC